MKKIVLISMIALISMSGCGVYDQGTRAYVGSQVGAFAGGVLGAVIGSGSNRWNGAELGAGLGSLAGSAAGAAIGAATTPQQPSTKPQPVYSNTNAHLNSPNLVIDDIYLEDENNNQCIDAGEACRMVFIILNNGGKTAYNVEPIINIDKGASYLRLSEPAVIGSISSEDKVSYSVKINASRKLPTGKAVFSVALKEANGYGKTSETFSVPTKGR
jgi:hypothetical protein